VRYAVSMPNFGVGLDAAAVGELAAVAERAGWDGFFLWDHTLAFPPGPVDLVDPWIALAVAATRTSRIRLGTLVTPLPRRRPVDLARQVVTLDRLSAGRVTLGVGTGAMPYEWDFSGEETDPVVRGDMLDEGLDVVTRLWSARPVRHEGVHYRLAGDDGWGALHHPPPVQHPRVPVWVATTWPGAGRPLRRAARWDGVVPMRLDHGWEPSDTAAVAAAVTGLRGSVDGFDVVVPGETDAGSGGAQVRAHAAAGATWWTEAVQPWRFGYTDGGAWPDRAMAARIAAGPPRD
jgi:alkanesulfonate monooxygenase SsuD/methylene tetrahydromethanopterin reductase-like flavin-dependent oxidoreductase (luciferase family)